MPSLAVDADRSVDARPSAAGSTPDGSDGGPDPRWDRAALIRALGALAVASGLVAIAWWWGEALIADGLRMKIHTPPLRGPTEWRPGVSALWAAGVAAAALYWWPRYALRVRWRTVLLVAMLSSIAWALALALVDGVSAITDPLVAPGQYINTVSRVGDLGSFLSTFSARIADYNIHTQGHPPGMVVVLWAMDAVGLGGPNWNAVLVFGGGGVAVVATLVAVRDVAGDAVARRSAPFLVLMPAAIWWSAGDPFFSAVGAAAVTLVILATSTDGRRSDAYAVAGGCAFIATAYLSYGLVLLGAIPLAVAIARRRLRPIVVATLTAGALVAVMTAATGFAWWEGLDATRERYFAGVANDRPYNYFLVANLAAFVIMIGPAAVVALARGRFPRDLTALLAGAVGAVVLADVSGMSKAEVERIWIPFAGWVMVATGAAFHSRRSQRGWLGAQVVVTMLVAVGVRSPW